MNNSVKKFLCSAITSGVFFTSLPAFAALPADVSGTKYEEPVQILSALNIMNGDENGEFRLDDTIIRSEAAKMAVHAIGLDSAAEASNGQSVFTDVSDEHWANGYISLAASVGLIEGDGDGTFRPNDTITYAEAMTIMVRATGYNISALNKGGFPSGYMSVGIANGMSKNVVCGQLEAITRGNIAFLTANALEVPMMEQKGYGNSVTYEITDKTLLSSKLNVTKSDGQITAVEKASLTGSSSLGKGQVTINEVTYESNLNLSEFLGYHVTYYVKDSNKGSSELILTIPVKNKNSSITIDSEAFAKLTEKNGNDAVSYYPALTSSTTSIAELAADPILIYNGKYEAYNKKYINLSSGSGHIKLLDADRDGKYEIVFVTKYENIVVESVTGSNKITDKYSGKVLKLDESINYTLTNGISVMKPSELREFDVLTVAKSLDESLVNITVTRNSIDGSVTGTDGKGVYVDKNHYKIASNYTDTLTIGMSGVFYLDAEGRIAAVNRAGKLSTDYAYLLKAYTDKNSDVSSFKLFTHDGKERTLEAKDKIKFNGTNGVKASKAVTDLTAGGTEVKQLITVTVNSDNKITAINTAKDNSSTGAADTSNFTKNLILSNTEYTASSSKLGNVRVSSSTIIFEIDNDTENYSIADKNIFEDKQSYDAIVYDMEENHTAKVIVLTGSSVKASADTSIAVVMNVVSAINDKDENAELLEALVDGKEVSVFSENENILVKGSKKLEEGDIIQYKTNSAGEITSIRVLMDISAKDNENTSSPAENLKTVYGKVTKKFSNSINVTVNNGSTVNYELNNDINVYLIDTAAAKNSVTTAEIADIQSFDDDENNRIFLRLYKDEVKEAVIIK